jgi:hypothetical protein
MGIPPLWTTVQKRRNPIGDRKRERKEVNLGTSHRTDDLYRVKVVPALLSSWFFVVLAYARTPQWGPMGRTLLFDSI